MPCTPANPFGNQKNQLKKDKIKMGNKVKGECKLVLQPDYRFLCGPLTVINGNETFFLC